MTFAQAAVETLSTAMRAGSRAEHEAAEASPFMSELLAGRVSEAGYAAYLGRLRQPYAILESVVRRHCEDPIVAAVYDPDLERLDALERDYDYWSSRAGLPAASTTPTRAVAAYAARLGDAAEWGGLLVAHHYTRYLGDLAGGQAIARVLRQHFELDAGSSEGTAFYDFPRVPRPKPYRDAYRARIDALDLTAAERAAIVEEVRTAFRLNRALFAELGAMLPTFRRSLV